LERKVAKTKIRVICVLLLFVKFTAKKSFRKRFIRKKDVLLRFETQGGFARSAI